MKNLIIFKKEILKIFQLKIKNISLLIASARIYLKFSSIFFKKYIIFTLYKIYFFDFIISFSYLAFLISLKLISPN